MCKLLVNTPNGDQQVINIKESGSYFDQSAVLWDSRIDGDLPENIELGKMLRKGKILIASAEYSKEYQAFLDKHAKDLEKEEKRKLSDEQVLSDDDVSALRSMDSKGIDDWFSANVTSLDESAVLLKKLIKVLVIKNIL